MPLKQYFKGKFRKKGFTRLSFVPQNFDGFTLIELLIVVAIIAILTGIGATRYQEVIRRGRDAQRKSDLRSVATALEQYYGDRSTYPVEDLGNGIIRCGSSLAKREWGTDTFDCIFGSTVVYSGTLPEDPQINSGHIQYYYEAREVDDSPGCNNTDADITNDCQRYVLAAVLENTNDPEIPQPSGVCFTSGGTEYNFCVHNP